MNSILIMIMAERFKNSSVTLSRRLGAAKDLGELRE